jgi:hypothetical protein
VADWQGLLTPVKKWAFKDIQPVCSVFTDRKCITLAVEKKISDTCERTFQGSVTERSQKISADKKAGKLVL